MRDRSENIDDIIAWLNSIPETNELLDELERLDIPEYDSNPEFITSIAKKKRRWYYYFFKWLF